MKNIIYILLVSFLLLSCGMMSKKEVTDQPPRNELTKLETLFCYLMILLWIIMTCQMIAL